MWLHFRSSVKRDTRMARCEKIPRMDGCEDANDEWQPPSEAELKIIQARRERQDKISKLMGDYLLKGYTMLGSICKDCDTILLRDKAGKNYCVACSELDSDISKDDPALNREAARRQVLEQDQRTQSSSAHQEDFEDAPILCDMAAMPSCSTTVTEPKPTPETLRLATYAGGSSQSQEPTTSVGVGTGTFSGEFTLPPTKFSSAECDTTGCGVGESVAAVCDKLMWATSELRKTNAVENSISLCQLIKSCADALESLQKLSRK